MVYSEAWGKLIHEKKRKLKISWHCPFKHVRPVGGRGEESTVRKELLSVYYVSYS